jgi:hypothetical protein
LNKLLIAAGYKTMEVPPTSTRKAQNISTKNIAEIQIIPPDEGPVLAFHEIDPITAALTAVLRARPNGKRRR